MKRWLQLRVLTLALWCDDDEDDDGRWSSEQGHVMNPMTADAPSLLMG